MLDPLIFWLLVYWLVTFIVFLTWYEREAKRVTKKEWITLAITFPLVGFIPPLAIMVMIYRWIRR